MVYHAAEVADFMKKLLVLLLLAGAAYAAYAFVIRPPEKRACMRVAELCGLDKGGSEIGNCVEMLDSLKKSNPDAVSQVTSCVGDAKSCGAAAGCASGAALSIGTGFVKDFLGGLAKTAK
jgi:hypothetical protein